ncbi:MAG TPA: helix-turn-helix domain-containing protein, partial [Thermoanaerobaculia bacterium]|nr:helix-turn-helix domain-containing protein [Thermoanaerobaculia bacterium]
ERRWTLKELSDAYIDETLRRAGGNRSLAAKRLGVSRKFLWERAKTRAKAPAGGRDAPGKSQKK